MVSCKSCKKKDKREYADDCFACDNGDKWEAKRHRSPDKPQTNADRIRAMSDEELADFLLHICDWKWMEWLKEEVSG